MKILGYYYYYVVGAIINYTRLKYIHIKVIFTTIRLSFYYENLYIIYYTLTFINCLVVFLSPSILMIVLVQ
jgi:hypothetical protein